MHTHPTERALARLAARQHGVLSLLQLREHGLSAKAIHGRVRSGRFRRLYRGVYSVGPLAPTRRGRELAAVLACGDGAALSHQSAAHAWLMMDRPSREIHVTCSRSRPPGPGIVVHRSPLGEHDRVVLDGIPVTTVARTIVDLADVAKDDEVVAVIERAEARRAFDLAEIRAVQARAPNRRGSRRLDRVLERWQPPPFTRAASERLFLALCKRHGLPRPLVNTWLGEQEVDFFWPDHKLVVEVDSGGTHMTRKAFEEDRRRDRRLAVRGIQVMRVTWWGLRIEADEIAAQLKAVLAARSPC
jgi:predicted transcriptional regulator of viral defense system